MLQEAKTFGGEGVKILIGVLAVSEDSRGVIVDSMVQIALRSEPIEESGIGFSVAVEVAAKFEDEAGEVTRLNEVGGALEDLPLGSFDIDLAGVDGFRTGEEFVQGDGGDREAGSRISDFGLGIGRSEVGALGYRTDSAKASWSVRVTVPSVSEAATG